MPKQIKVSRAESSTKVEGGIQVTRFGFSDIPKGLLTGLKALTEYSGEVLEQNYQSMRAKNADRRLPRPTQGSENHGVLARGNKQRTQDVIDLARQFAGADLKSSVGQIGGAPTIGSKLTPDDVSRVDPSDAPITKAGARADAMADDVGRKPLKAGKTPYPGPGAAGVKPHIHGVNDPTAPVGTNKVLSSIKNYKMMGTGFDENGNPIEVVRDPGKKVLGAISRNKEASDAFAKATQKALTEKGVKYIYRGGDQPGISWSTSKTVAQSFAGKGGKVERIELTPEVMKRVFWADSVMDDVARRFGFDPDELYEGFAIGEKEVILLPLKK